MRNQVDRLNLRHQDGKSYVFLSKLGLGCYLINSKIKYNNINANKFETSSFIFSVGGGMSGIEWRGSEGLALTGEGGIA